MPTHAVNTFRLRPGVSVAEFEAFSAELDRPTCLAFDVVLAFDVYVVDPADDSGVDVVEVMTVASWPDWERVRDTAPELKPVVDRFDELVDPDSVTTLLTRKTPLPQEI
ncbi:hypothetical protein MMAD_42180 [Mycolicibacterium madagascariense]|uniref:REDY-like protein HapK n=1 Tax=Mycolicibacterium madagascariense TaxID=212765 RepID=A0A7I7XLH1_9MYCO|nr:hypothetical protein [Mycolicibacterium madagascariense]MCV7011625.1 hypothetical protein [Mycolicibacterium madagascariense]BBZ29923.1 hypothetical protein MMAD_42180 [Mycolicibacterium madagascariense]